MRSSASGGAIRAAARTHGVPAHRQAEQGSHRDLQALCMLGIGMGRTYTGPLPEARRAIDNSLGLCAGDPLVGMAHVGFQRA